MPVLCIVSGGNTGTEQAGLRAAKGLGLKTGGFAAQGWITEKGAAPWLGTMFGLTECEGDYAERTELNVTIADGTVIFGVPSPGSDLTHACCLEQVKPHIWLREYQQVNAQPRFRMWLERNHITRLNVAGNRESKSPGIGYAVERFLMEVLPLCK